MNKNQRDLMEKSLDQSKKENFDLYLKGPDSTHIKAKTVKWDTFDQSDVVHKVRMEDVNNSRDVYNPDYENTLMRESIRQHQEKLNKLSKKDKITFSILKWIFNAIQRN